MRGRDTDGIGSERREQKKEKKSKFKEKFNFNKSMNEFYKGSDILNERLQSGRKKK